MTKINERHIVASCEGAAVIIIAPNQWVYVALIQVLLVDGTALHHRKAFGIILKLFDEEPT